MSPYWQHREPLKCPKGHVMTWLGTAYWICGRGKCGTIYVALKPATKSAAVDPQAGISTD